MRIFGAKPSGNFRLLHRLPPRKLLGRIIELTRASAAFLQQLMTRWCRSKSRRLGSLSILHLENIPNLGGEPLERRAMLAAFTYDSISEKLTIDLDQADEVITLTSQGGGNYTFSSTDTFSGDNATGLTGSGSSILEITAELNITSVSITDSNNNTSVIFGTSTGSFVDNVTITLDSSPGSLTIANQTEFAGSSALSASGSAIAIDDALTMSSGTVTLNAAAGIDGAGLVTADTVDLDAVTGIGATTPLNLAAATITADTTNGDIDIANILATAVNVTTLTTGTGNITFAQSGGGDANFATATTDDGSINLSVAGGDLTVGTAVTAGGAITISSDSMNIVGVVNSRSNQTTLRPMTPGYEIDLGAAGGLISALELSDAEVDKVTAGELVIGSATAGNITISSPISPANTTILSLVTNGAINGAGLVTAGTVDLNAVTGVGDTTPLNLAAATITADTTNGDIDIANSLNATVDVTSLTTGAGNITFAQSGGGDANFATATAGNGSIDLSVAGGDLTVGTEVTANGTAANVALLTTTSGNVTLTGTVTAAGDQINITSAGAIDGAGLVAADTVDLGAETGVGDTIALNLAAATITADTTNGDIDIANALNATVNVTTLTTGTGKITFAQSGGGDANFATATAGNGSIDLSVDDGDLTVGAAVTANGTAANVTLLTTTSGNVTLTGTVTATGDQVSVTSAGAIDGAGLVTADTVDLDAGTGIGATTPLNLAAATITADTTNGDIDIANSLNATVDVTSLTTGTGNITFAQSGGGGANFATATTVNGSIDLSVAGGDLTVGTAVTANGTTANVTLLTTTSGNVTLTGTVTAKGDQVSVTSAGSINGAGLVTAGVVDLNAVTGIGATTPLKITPLNLAATTITADTSDGNITIANTLATAVDVTTLTTGTGNITFAQSGGGDANFATATTVNGSIDLSVAGGDLTVGTAVMAGGISNISLLTLTSGDVILNGTVTAVGDRVSITAAGGITGVSDGYGNPPTDPVADITALRVDLQADGGDLVATVAATKLYAATTGSNNDLNITLIGRDDVFIGPANSNVALSSSGNLTFYSVNTDGVGDAGGNDIIVSVVPTADDIFWHTHGKVIYVVTSVAGVISDLGSLAAMYEAFCKYPNQQAPFTTELMFSAAIRAPIFLEEAIVIDTAVDIDATLRINPETGAISFGRHIDISGAFLIDGQTDAFIFNGSAAGARLAGFAIYGFDEAGAAAVRIDGVDNIQIDNNIFGLSGAGRIQANLNAISVENSTGSNISANTIAESREVGILVQGSRNLTIRQNSIGTLPTRRRDYGNAVGIHLDGVYNGTLSGDNRWSISNVTIDDNVIAFNTDLGINVSDALNVTVRGNEFWQNFLALEVGGQSDDTTIQDNMVLKGGSDGIVITGQSANVTIGGTGTDEANFIGTTDRKRRGLGNRANGILIDSTGTGNQVVGNTIMGNGTRRSSGHQNGVRVEGGATIDVDSNDISENRGDGVRVDSDAEVVFRGNRITKNYGSGIVLDGASVVGHVGNLAVPATAEDQNELLSNRRFGIEVIGSATADIGVNVMSGNRRGGISGGIASPVIDSAVFNATDSKLVVTLNTAVPEGDFIYFYLASGSRTRTQGGVFLEAFEAEVGGQATFEITGIDPSLRIRRGTTMTAFVRQAAGETSPFASAFRVTV